MNNDLWSAFHLVGAGLVVIGALGLIPLLNGRKPNEKLIGCAIGLLIIGGIMAIV